MLTEKMMIVMVGLSVLLNVVLIVGFLVVLHLKKVSNLTLKQESIIRINEIETIKNASLHNLITDLRVCQTQYAQSQMLIESLKLELSMKQSKSLSSKIPIQQPQEPQKSLLDSLTGKKTSDLPIPPSRDVEGVDIGDEDPTDQPISQNSNGLIG